MSKKYISLISVLLLLVIWQIIAWFINRPELFPSVFQLLKTLASLFTSLSFYQSVGITVLRGLTGILISITTAIIFSLLFARSKWLYELFRPLLTIMRSVPVISFILLALIFLHPESIPLLIAFLVMFPLLTENLTKGILNLRPGYNAMAKVFHINGKNRILHIYYPQLKPFIYSGLSSAMGFGWRAIIMGEVLAQCTYGIGGEMKRAQLFIEIPQLIAWTVIAIIISYLFDKGITKLEQIHPSISYSSKNKRSLENLPIIITDLSFSYGENKVLSDFSYTFEKGKTYGISAPSGVGKTTLLNLINGLLIPGKGDIKVQRINGIATVFQESELLPYLSVIQNIILPLTSYYTHKEAYELAQNVLFKMEINSYKDFYPDKLSYGQQQRVAIARALAFPSPILLMDEPFKGLDEKLTKHIITYILKRQAEYKQTIIFTTHKQEELNLLAGDIILL